MSGDLRVWVVDTSSLIQIRRAGMTAAQRANVFELLTTLARQSRVLFPPQVREELELGAQGSLTDDALKWVRSVRSFAEHVANLETVTQVLARAPELIDADSERDQADPYVVALAINSPSLGGVSILSEDRRDHFDGFGKLQKMSVATAAGLWDIPVAPLAGFTRRLLG